LTANLQMPLPTRHEVPLSSSGRDQSKAFAFRQELCSVEGKDGKGTTGHSRLEALVGFMASGTLKRTTFSVESYAPGHRLLAPGYHRDFVATLLLVEQIERLGQKAPQQFCLYNKVCESLRGDKAASFIELDRQQRLFYRAKIPSSLRETIARPDALY
jgi:hypothetical protein